MPAAIHRHVAVPGMHDPGPTVRLPAERFVSQAEFEAQTDEARAAAEAQALFEDSLATRGDTIVRDATCAPCLRRVRLTSRVLGRSRTADGGRVPDWPRAQECDCEDRLSGGDRLILHALLSEAGLRPWSRLLLFGPAAPVDRRARALAGETVAVFGVGEDQRIAAGDGSCHVLLAHGCLHRAAPLGAILRELRRVAAPEACLLATVPFRSRAAVTTSRAVPPEALSHGFAPGEVHAIGWDILTALRVAGWAEAAMLRVWSNELGYLGSQNFVVRAVA